MAIFGAVVKVHEVHPYGKSPRERHNFAKNAPNPGKAAALIRSEKEAGKTDPRKNSCQASEKSSMVCITNMYTWQFFVTFLGCLSDPFRG